MAKNFESIKEQIKEIQRNNQRDFDRGQQLDKFVDSCSAISNRIAGDVSNATYQRGSDSNSKIAKGLKPLECDIEIMNAAISELSRINEENKKKIDDKLELIRWWAE